MNFKNIILAFSIFLPDSIICMQAPLQQSTASWDSLPKEIKLLVVPLIASSNVYEVTKTILALNHTNKFFREFVRSKSGMLSIMERMPYAQNTVDLAAALHRYADPKTANIWRYYIPAQEKLINGKELLLAAKKNNITKARNLLRCKYIELNNTEYEYGPPGDSLANTPLLWAIENGNEEMAIILIKAGANPNCYNRNYCTPYKLATMRGQRAIVELLLAFGADIWR